ncbi:efflux RND transporter permease subunit, partial [Bacillus subtilis]|nr:efflux RND transporter permease subunit [Bacillus subtilis]
IGLPPRFGTSLTGRRVAPAETSPMLKLVRLALARPYTFIVLALLILIAGPLAALRTPTDIFPDIRIPVISVVWNYAGLQPADMSGRIVTYY